MKLLSIIVPIYKSEFNIPVAIERIEELKNRIYNKGFDLEVIFVDDGSPDNSYIVLKKYKAEKKWIKLVKFTRNFGVPYAALAGLEYAKGDCGIVLVPDMQDPPELIDEMLDKWINGTKIVIAEREDREEPFSQKIVSNLFHFLMKNFALRNYPEKGSDLILLDRKVIDYMNCSNEKNTNYLSLILYSGFEYETIYYTRKKREVGKSSYTFAKKLKYAVDSFISFSYIPIRVISLIGIIVSILSFVFGLYVIINTLFFGSEVKGYTTIISLVTFLLGLLMFMLGIIGEYLWRILDEVKSRPRYVVEEEIL